MADVWSEGGNPPEPVALLAEVVGSTDLAVDVLITLGKAGYRLIYDAPWERLNDGQES